MLDAGAGCQMPGKSKTPSVCLSECVHVCGIVWDYRVQRSDIALVMHPEIRIKIHDFSFYVPVELLVYSYVLLMSYFLLPGKRPLIV